MSRVPVTPENPLGLVHEQSTTGIFIKAKFDSAHCPICGREAEAYPYNGVTVLAGHHASEEYEGVIIQGGPWDKHCPGSRMILEEYQPVTLEDCNRKLDEILEELEG